MQSVLSARAQTAIAQQMSPPALCHSLVLYPSQYRGKRMGAQPPQSPGSSLPSHSLKHTALMRATVLPACHKFLLCLLRTGIPSGLQAWLQIFEKQINSFQAPVGVQVPAHLSDPPWLVHWVGCIPAEPGQSPLVPGPLSAFRV